MTRFLQLFLLLTGLLVSVLAQAVPQDKLLPANEAFKVEAARTANHQLQVRFNIAAGYYLYRDRIKISLSSPKPGLSVTLPNGKTKADPNFGNVVVYHTTVIAHVKSDTPLPDSAELIIQSQGCADAGLCYPPQTLRLPIGKLPARLPPPATDKPPALKELFGQANSAPSGQLFNSASLPALLAFFFVAGLGLSFTACMYPLLPIVTGVILGQGKHPSRTRSLLLTLAYVQGLAMTYALAGIAAALTGTLLSNALQQPWVLGVFGLFLVGMALSMFGLFNLQLPSGIQSRFNDLSNRLPGGHLLPAFAMGALSAVIVGPCVAPPLAAALGYIGTTGNIVIGGLSLYVMALGTGVPLIVIGVFGGHYLPRAGGWMTTVRQVCGVIMLLAALWISSPVMPAWLVMSLLGAILIGSAVYLHALDSLPPHANNWKRLWKALGVMLLIAGASLLIGVLSGNRDLLAPLARPTAAVESRLPFQRVRTLAELDAALSQAKERQQAVMLDFYADWCVSCKEMEKLTFADPKVRQALGNTLLLQADVTANSADDAALLQRFGLYGPPGILFFGKDGQPSAVRVIGFMEAAAFRQQLQAAGITS